MKCRRWRRLGVGVGALLCVSLFAAVAFAEMPAARAPDTQGVAHHWVAEQAGFAPYTEITAIERVAKVAAARALKTPRQALISQADHGYLSATQSLALASSLKKAKPEIIGHELIVFNEKKAARVYVGQEGDVRLLETGDTRPMLVTRTVSATDHGDADALDIAKRAIGVGSALGASPFRVDGVLVTAHAVGFVDADGSHMVVRVDPDGNASYTDW